MDKVHTTCDSINEKGVEALEELERRVRDVERRLDTFERYFNSTTATGDALKVFHEMKDSLKKELRPSNPQNPL